MNRDFVVSGLRKRGYSQVAAEGIAMNGLDESGFNPKASGDNGNAYGIFQWNGPRKRNLFDFAARNGRDASDPDLQLDFLDHELKNQYSGVTKRMGSAKSAGEAAVAFLEDFERPAKKHRDERRAKYLGAPGNVPGNGMAFVEPANGQAPPQIAEEDPAIGYGSMVESVYSPKPPEEQTAFGKWLGEKAPWLTESRGEKLLAIGSGLLSGEDWASGLSAAGTNFQGILSEEKTRQQAEQDMRNKAMLENGMAARDQQYALQQRAAGQKDRQVSYDPMGAVIMADGSTRSDIQHGSDGFFYDGNLQRISPEDAATMKLTTRSDASGARAQPTRKQINDMKIDLEARKGSLEAMDRIITTLRNDPKNGYQRLAQQGQAIMKTALGMGLTPEQVRQQILTSDFAGLAKLAKEVTNGTGVMTDQDALRAFAWLGGDPSSWLTNSEVVLNRMETLRKQTLDSYSSSYTSYNDQKEQWPQLLMADVNKYTDPRAEDKSGVTPENRNERPQNVSKQMWDSWSPKTRELYWSKLDEARDNLDKGKSGVDKSKAASTPKPASFGPEAEKIFGGSWDDLDEETKKQYLSLED